MRNKVIVILSVLLVLSTSMAVIGYLNHNKKPPIEIEIPKKVITYEFYLEDQLVDEIPKNDENNKYVFSKYQCENGIMVIFDTETWTYKVDDENEEKEGLCKLYFVKGSYEVTLSATNGQIDEKEASSVFNVDRENDLQATIVPNEGYEYSNVECANEKEAIYDISSNTLTINSIMEDIGCKINFKIKTLKMDLTVKNGKGTTTETAKYGETVSAVVKANEGYEKPKIECNNDQEFIFEDNKLTIEKLTNNTKCTVTFSKAPIITYKLIINDIPEQVVVTSGNQEQVINAGKDGKISLKPNAGYDIKLDCGGIKPSSEEKENDGTINYVFLEMTKDITCDVLVSSVNIED